jgi:2-keto-4-pentenoate hydratase/2-oxohepta-3-ene-1,7-dioic acid hydratase in catechol pathway
MDARGRNPGCRIMKLVTYRRDGRDRVGSVKNGNIIDLSSEFPTMLSLIEAGQPGLSTAARLTKEARDTVALGLATLLAPIPRPVQMRDCLAFEEHLKNSAERLKRLHGYSMSIPDVWYEQPIYYKCNRMSVIGPDATIRWPSYADQLDYELELACIIGKQGVDVSEEDASNHIFGFTIFNDVSARDAQAREMSGSLGPAKGKDFDTGNILGPWIVTSDELGDVYNLAMEVRVNGEKRGGGNTSAMHHSFARMIAHISQSETLYCGEVIGSGTVGTGCGLETGTFLEDGDVIELEIERIGVLRNSIRRSPSHQA